MNRHAEATAPRARRGPMALFWGAVVLCAAADLFLWLSGAYHGRLPIENLPLFGATSGFLGALAIAGLAKLLGGLLLTRKEDYYG